MNLNASCQYWSQPTLHSLRHEDNARSGINKPVRGDAHRPHVHLAPRKVKSLTPPPVPQRSEKVKGWPFHFTWHSSGTPCIKAGSWPPCKGKLNILRVLSKCAFLLHLEPHNTHAEHSTTPVITNQAFLLVDGFKAHTHTPFVKYLINLKCPDIANAHRVIWPEELPVSAQNVMAMALCLSSQAIFSPLVCPEAVEWSRSDASKLKQSHVDEQFVNLSFRFGYPPIACAWEKNQPFNDR